MQYKWRVSCLALMVGGYFVQDVSASPREPVAPCGFYGNNDEGANTCVEASVFSGQVYVEGHNRSDRSISSNTFSIQDGRNVTIRRVSEKPEKVEGREGYGFDSEKNVVIFGDRASILLGDGRVALKDSVIKGSDRVYVTYDGKGPRPGHAVDNTVSDDGILYIFSGGLSENTVVKDGGVESVSIWGKSRVISAYAQNRGFSLGSIVEVGGEQRVEGGGSAAHTVVIGGDQRVFGAGLISVGRPPNGINIRAEAANSSVYYSTIQGKDEIRGRQQVYDGGVAFYTKVMSGGVQDVGTENLEAGGGFVVDTEVFADGQQNILGGGGAIGVTLNQNATQEVYAGGYVVNLTLNDNATSFVHAGAVLEETVEVNHSGRFDLEAGSAGHQTLVENVVLNGKDAVLSSVASKVDGEGSLISKLSGDGHVMFTSVGSEPHYSSLHVKDLSGHLHFSFNTDLANNRGDSLLIDEGTGEHTVSVRDSGAEVADPSVRKRDLIIDKSKKVEARFSLTDPSGKRIDAIDIGAYMYALNNKTGEGEKVWYLGVAEDPKKPSGGSPNFLTSPSTDAVLSMSVIPALVADSELQSLRSGRGIVDRSRKDSSLWTQAFSGKEVISVDHTHFDLRQTGAMLGADRSAQLSHGKLYIGGFGGYNRVRVSHDRGGVSVVKAYSAGAYATYFDDGGWYLDGVLKYSYYQNNLKAISTGGLPIQGDYKQRAISNSFETGYRFRIDERTWVQPHVHLAFFKAEGKEAKLSNGMVGNIRPFVSLRSEVGSSIGHSLNMNESTALTAYLTAAWLHEYANHNNTVINKLHKFTTDFSGDFGKLAIGLNGSVGKNLSLYAEAQYLKGRKINQSLQGVLGVRYSF